MENDSDWRKDWKVEGEAVHHVDATPDDGYVLRVLQASLDNNTRCIITDNTEGRPPSNPALIAMNEAAAERARLLRDAMAKLAAPYAALLPRVRAIARDLGYAIGAHGSAARDFDLIAAPWTDAAVDAATLAESLRVAVGGFFAASDNLPHKKPHGRLAWIIHLGGGPYVDLSVMPRPAAPPEIAGCSMGCGTRQRTSSPTSATTD